MSVPSSRSSCGVQGRYIVVGAAAVFVAMIWSHAIAAVLRASMFPHHSVRAWPLSIASVILSLLLLCLGGKYSWRVTGGFGGLALSLLFVNVYPGAWTESLALLMVSVGLAFGIERLLYILPENLGCLLFRCPYRGSVWILLVVLCLIQYARLSTYMTDPQSDWFLSTRHVGWAKHECLPAYLYGAELAAGGESNVYNPLHYPGLNPEAKVNTQMVGMSPEDPFQYTPLFLLLPHVAMLISHDYAALRVVWFALQSTFFVGVVVTLGVWVGGRGGRTTLWLLPLFLSSFPVLSNLQFGQFHGFALCLALIAMLAIERGWSRLGGTCLAMATASKIFPGLLLLVLAMQRRWRALAWAFGSLTFAGALTLVVFGSAPFVAFVSDHLPRLASGQAFAFGDVWPELRTLVIGANHGFFGLVTKLGELGVPGATSILGRWINRGCGLVLIGLALWWGQNHRNAEPQIKVMAWLGLLGLASLLSTGAFVDYVSIPAVWMLTFAVPRSTVLDPNRNLEFGRRWVIWPIWILWSVVLSIHYFMIGGAPIGTFEDPSVLLPVSSASALILILTFVGPFVGPFWGSRFTRV